MKNFAELTIKDYKAIKSANILLNGITVVSGINGSGKSSMSKLLYYVFRNANNFEELVLTYTKHQIRPYLSVLEQIQSFLVVYNKESHTFFRKAYYKDLDLYNLDERHNTLEVIRDICNKFIELEKNLLRDGNFTLTHRIRMILRSTLKVHDEKDTKVLLDILVKRISDHFSRAEQLLIERPYKMLKPSLDSVFGYDLTKKVIVKEYGDVIFGENITNVPLLHYIKKVAYVDTPMAIGLDAGLGQPEYWSELNSFLKVSPKRGYKRSINKFIKDEILKGDILFSDDVFSGGFKYKRLDGQEFDLSECATGIKSFSLMQLLLKNLFLDENTLMIIDEPEAHLHPQWIIEYARLIVWLYKEVGVKFFIASHSTDMVSAIRYIAEKEKCLSFVSFYIADKKNESFSFRYLEHDIEPIFESFNKSFERLDFYVNSKK